MSRKGVRRETEAGGRDKAVVVARAQTNLAVNGGRMVSDVCAGHQEEKRHRERM